LKRIDAVDQVEAVSWLGRLIRTLTPKTSRKPPLRRIIRKRKQKRKTDPATCAMADLKNIVETCDQGYPYVATFLDSDENFMIYRRFGFLHARLLLQKQDELRLLERDLDRMDQRDKTKNVKLLQCRVDDELRTDSVPESRRALFLRIEDIVLQYDQLLFNAQQLAAANRPPERDYKSVAKFMDHKKPLMRGDDDFIYNKEDLITLRPGRESAWLDTFIERLLKLCPRRAVKYIFCSQVIPIPCKGVKSKVLLT
jgi:hypothetical protein